MGGVEVFPRNTEINTYPQGLAIMSDYRFLQLAFSAFVCLLFPISIWSQDRSQPAKVVVRNDGTVEVPAQVVPMSTFLSPEAKAYVTQHLKDMQDPEILKQDAGVPRFMKGYIARDYELFAFEKKDQKIGGVHVFVYTPKNGVSAENKSRVLINLHGGGFSGCWPGCAELESIPVAALGQIEVVSVDYREGPDHKFPAASEDVATVYQELLKTYKPKSIGIYGCSAGGMQAALSVAWFGPTIFPRREQLEFSARAPVAFSGAMRSTRLGRWARRGWLRPRPLLLASHSAISAMPIQTIRWLRR